MAKNKFRKRTKRKSFTLPMAIIGGFAIPVVRAGKAFQSTGITGAGDELIRDFTGFQRYDGTWDYKRMQYGILPVGVGVLIHKLAGMTGVNRAIAAAGIPVFRI